MHIWLEFGGGRLAAAGPTLLLSKPAHKRLLFLIFGKKSTFVRGFRMEKGLGHYVKGRARRAPLRHLSAPCALRRKTLARFPGSAPSRVRIPGVWPKPKNGPVVGAVSKSMVGDEGFEPPALCV